MYSVIDRLSGKDGGGAASDRTRWTRLLVAFFVSHHVGDFLLQTNWQARHKAGGLGGDREARGALLRHGLTYTLAFAPPLLSIVREDGARNAACVAALIFVPHVVLDDRRLVAAYLRRVKRVPEQPDPILARRVDQAFHFLCLWAAVVVAERLSSGLAR